MDFLKGLVRNLKLNEPVRHQDRENIFQQMGEQIAGDIHRQQEDRNVARPQDGQIRDPQGEQRNAGNVARRQEGCNVDQQRGDEFAGRVRQQQEARMVDQQRAEQQRNAGNVAQRQEGRNVDQQRGDEFAGRVRQQQEARMVDQQRAEQQRNVGNVAQRQKGRNVDQQRGDEFAGRVRQQQEARKVDQQRAEQQRNAGNVARRQEGRNVGQQRGDEFAGRVRQQQEARKVDQQRAEQQRNAGNVARRQEGRNLDQQRGDQFAGRVRQQEEPRMMDQQGAGQRNAGNVGRQQRGRTIDRQRDKRNNGNVGRHQRGHMIDRQRDERIDDNVGGQPAQPQLFGQQRRGQYARNSGRQNQDNPEDIGPQNNNNRNNKPMGFKHLEEISKSSCNDIIMNIAAKRESFIKLLQSCSDKPDTFVLILKIISEVSKSNMVNQKLNLLLDICNTPVLDAYLLRYLMDLPYTSNKSTNQYYWRNPDEFWLNLTQCFECLLTITPSTVVKKYRPLIDAGTKCCLAGLQDRHKYVLPDNCEAKLKNLREQLIVTEEEEEKKKKPTRQILLDENEAPPENFRELNVIPGKEELLIDSRPYVRANLIKGGYTDIEHYLDVQFRLLREDCFAPLRWGLAQYLKHQTDPTKNERKTKFDGIRVFRDVMFVEPYVSRNKVGTVIEISASDKKRFKNIRWTASKRFIFGSLLILTKDNFNTCISVTVLDRDVNYISSGKIPVTVYGLAAMSNLYNDDLYIMVESEIYFEPYYHVLKSLQDPTFPEKLRMQQYIVHADMNSYPPAYVKEGTIYSTKNYTFQVLSDSWPSARQLGYDNSQYEAYRLALTHEFVVLQGPPGTGKTFIGVEIARTLLQNLIVNSGPIMLIICYTNHALDQFLEAILKVTEDVVRIGGQSKNEAMEKINLVNLRRSVPQRKFKGNKLLYENRHELKLKTNELLKFQTNLQAIDKGVVSTKDLLKRNPEVQFIARRYNGNDDPVKSWLFNGIHNYATAAPVVEEEADEIEVEEEFFEEDDIARTHVILDDFDDIENVDNTTESDIQLSFCVKEVQSQIKTREMNLKKQAGSYNKKQADDTIKYSKAQIRLFEDMKKMKSKSQKTTQVIDERTDVGAIPVPQRWQIYFKWTKVLEADIQNKVKLLTDAYQAAEGTYEEARSLMDLQLLQHTKVIGMTTSGAARLRKLLQSLTIPIVIVEEAAEVLEQHIVASLPSSCDHLILIGDHQQLRPSAACMQLARHYNIEISLFERMIMNDVHNRRLGVQHRMRPEIAALICPHIYKDLQNHESVENFPNVRGITSNVFFLSHNYKEKDIEDSSSRSNPEEGDLVLGLANYIMQQDYEPEDVTILAAYSGQMFYLRQQRSNYAFLSKIKITVVDNYQGEESKIILLSLVRNNLHGKIGFLGTENRICVALSRAKEGLYIVGNIEILKERSALWKNISATLEEKDSVGNGILLQCEIHRNEFTTVSKPDDFRLVPEGGCLQKCTYELPCHHLCSLVCHAYDRNHVNIICKQKCERILCERNHVCPLQCAKKCRNCIVMVKKEFPCGHTNSIQCHLDPNNPDVHCLTIVTVELPDCKHKMNKECHLKEVACPVPCPLRVSKCGHMCARRCHVTDDPDHEKYQCHKPCAKANKGCSADLVGSRGNHQCQKLCYQDCEDCRVEVVKKRDNCTHKERVQCHIDVNAKPCSENCRRVMECGHYCKRKCFEPCGGCDVKVVKKIPDCGHEIEVACSMTPTKELCKKKCERTLACGHKCRSACRAACDPALCTEVVGKLYKSPCGHNVQLPCNFSASGDKLEPEALLKYCTEPCNVMLACEHVCSGTCSGCLQGRIHVPCTETCHQLNICSHRCSEPCKKMCPPCKQKCPVRCPHSACGNLCGEPCSPCQEPCTRGCRHGGCVRRCGEPCSCAPCSQPCARPLPCGHPCRGYCGEPCPPACRACAPDAFPRDFLGDAFDDDARFILLEDCNHILESEDMNNLMTGDQEEVSIRSCPFCRAPIINTYRYKDVINKMIKTELNPIKEKVFGTAAQIRDKKSKLINEIEAFFKDYNTLFIGKNRIQEASDTLYAMVKSRKKVSVMQLDMHEIYLDILTNVAKVLKMSKTCKEDLEMRSDLICRALRNNVEKISQQLQQDLSNEIKRMHAIVQLGNITSHPTYAIAKSKTKVQAAAQTAFQLILGWQVFDERSAYDSLDSLQEEVKVTGLVTREEIDLVVKAVGLKKGHWFKCPNGHFYCIGDCGGAMVIGKCVECGVAIGGTNHTLLGTNSLAREIDGSQFAAWSEEYNNMANFRF